MKFVLFCQNPYAFGILEPIMQVLKEKDHDYLWFLTEKLEGKFPFPKEPNTHSITALKEYQSDAILCPGNEVPHYLRGLKVQIFHGLAGEKKGHFRIRHYFDLYLTQGPYFTNRFNQLKEKHKNFEVIETGWSKLDVYARNHEEIQREKEQRLKNSEATKIVLYAPTFSPSLTSAPYLLEELEKLAENKEYLILVKFHDLMAPDLIEKYRNLAEKTENIVVEKEANIVKFLIMGDLLISDTSSVVYEFLLLDKPVVTFKNNSDSIKWEDSSEFSGLSEKVARNLEEDSYEEQRRDIINNYHPYHDGQSSLRMVNAIEEYIQEHGVPEQRKLSFLRRRKINRMFN